MFKRAKIFLIFFAVAAVALFIYFRSNSADIQSRADSFTGFDVTGINLYEGKARLRPKTLTLSKISTLNYELNQWWLGIVDQGWKKEWVTAFPSFVVHTSKGDLNFHGRWVVIGGSDEQLSKLLTPEQAGIIDKIKSRFEWTEEQ